MKTIRILLLEDDLETVSKLIAAFQKLEQELKQDISVMVLSEYTQAEALNKTNLEFDIILLDRDCKAAGSFHVLDLEKFGIDKVIAISSTPPWNIEAQSRGVTHVVEKTYHDLDTFTQKVIETIRSYFLK